MSFSGNIQKSLELDWSKLQIGAIFGLLLLCYAPALAWLLQIWGHSGYDANGVVVPFLAAGMLLIQRRRLAETVVAPSAWGLPLASSGVLLCLAGYLAGIRLVMGLSLIVTIYGIVLGIWGAKMWRHTLYAVTFLVLMFPVYYPLEVFISFPMRLISTKLAAVLLGFSGLPVQVSGTMISTSAFQMSIESPCSGIKSLSSLVIFGGALAYFMHRDQLSRLVLLLLVLPITLLANSFRIFIIGLIGHYYGYETALGFFHSLSGLIAFLAAVVLMLGVSTGLIWLRKTK
jgi:exosortase